MLYEYFDPSTISSSIYLNDSENNYTLDYSHIADSFDEKLAS